MPCATAQLERSPEEPGFGEETPRDLGINAILKDVDARRSEGDGAEVLAHRAQGNGGGRSARERLAVAPQADRPEQRNDFSVWFPERDRIVVRSHRFKSWNHPWVREFIETTFGVREVRSVEIDTFRHEAHLRHAKSGKANILFQRLAGVYRGTESADLHAIFPSEVFQGIPANQPRLRTYRYGRVVSTWELRREVPGRIRLRNPFVLNKEHLLRLLERELITLFGIESFRFERWTGSVAIEFRPEVIRKEQIIRHLDAALTRREKEKAPRDGDHMLRVATVSLALSAGASFVTPALLPAGALLMLYTAIPSFRRAYHAVAIEKRLGVDVLDSIIFVSCLFTGQIFAGAMTAWFLSLGRKLLKQTEAESSRMLLQVFGRQAALARVRRDGRAVETPLEEIRHGDHIEIHTGEAVPVDGVIIEGDAVIDQHTLTGESIPVEKAAGDRVLASTLVVAGSIVVEVERAGQETVAGQISEILTRTIAYKLEAQSRGEKLADTAVLPTLGLATVAAAVGGSSSALAVINSEMGTGIRMAAPLGMLNAIASCARNGILVKDGRALERMRQVDTVLFDKTGTLTRERPEVHRVFCHGKHTEDEILTWAAAAEQRFSHPIAQAVLERFRHLDRPIPALDSSRYKVGYGITVELDGRTVRVGSRRFMDQEKIPVPDAFDREMRRLHADGHSFVCVATEEDFAGVLELRSSHRSEAEEIVTGLRARGIAHIAIVSGDHEKPTHRLARQLGMDRHFAEVLPHEKGRYIELLQKEGHTVCFVGDGINDAIALKKADVSISLRGASTIAIDAAQIVFMKENLWRVCDLFDFSNALERNLRRSWDLIAVPNGLCIAGVFLFGFNIWHSVAFNNLSAIAALLNGLLPLRQAARRHLQHEQKLATELGARIP